MISVVQFVRLYSYLYIIQTKMESVLIYLGFLTCVPDIYYDWSLIDGHFCLLTTANPCSAGQDSQRPVVVLVLCETANVLGTVFH